MDQVDFLNHYNPLFQQLQYNNQSWQNSGIEIRYYLNQLGLKSSSDFLLGNQKIFLKFSVWDKLELELRYLAKLVKNNPEKADGNGEKGLFCEEGQLTEVPLKDGDDSRELTLSPSTSAQDTLRGSEPLEKEVASRTTTQRPKVAPLKPARPPTMIRRWWVRLTWLMTWWIPTIWISRVLKKNRKDQQMAWREKVAICELIVFSWVVILFVNIGLGLILCPPNKVWTVDEVRTLQGEEDLGVYMRGIVYDIAKFAKSGHGKDWQPQGVDQDYMYEFGGKDVSTTFPIPLFVGCSGLIEDQQFQLKRNLTDDTSADMIFVHTSGPRTQFAATDMEDPTWYFTKVLPKLKTMKKGEVVWSYKNLYDMRTDGNRQVGIINDKVYDLTQYFETVSQPEYRSKNSTIKAHFLPDPIEQMFGPNSKQQDPELTRIWNNNIGLNDMERRLVMNCLNNQFYIGKVDKRQTFRCQFTNYLLLSFSVFVLSVTLVKFLAALQLTSKKDPGEGEKFVICQIPCYTENEDSIRASLDSIAELKYDHRRKLMFIITDGMVIGSGCDKSTPDILCEILGIEKPDFETNCKYFESVGEGKKQHNRGVVYSGLYQSEGSSVPYLLVVKVGRPDERVKPGNRGKRDSQIVLMRFLNRVHYDTPMWPLEIEMYHHIKNVIGVDPKLYEYVLMVDADTRVLSDSLTRLISTMQRDNRIAGLCGETQLENENDSFTTMIQIYEYYISHHLSKAFESLFGTVTCLPGCFCMYRIRSVKNAPLLISDKVIKEYSRSDVNTLHLKNLLWLGEDRYLTTLMMKHFPNYKLKFTPDAKCLTVAPHKFNVLLSQRRRWINSTIHNLLELVMLKDMCGFCCFSMRFVVLLDLMGTLILPATVFYLAYIIIAACVGFQYISNLSLIIMGSIYILQALIFILKHQWQHIGWMIFYLIGMPLFNVFIPMYSYWHLDDFSWGNTRQVMGD
ncbi:glycosyltransferase family 2 protein, partial [Conidiobolus coronatus NRRL 28638]